MGWEVLRYPEFRDDLQSWYKADAALGEHLIKKCYAIEENPLKGEPKRGGPIAGCRAVYARGTDYAVIYENEPDVLLPQHTDSIDYVHFYGIKTHDNQHKARTGTETPIDSIYEYEIIVPAGKSGEIRAALHDAEGIHPDDDRTEWDDEVTFRGEYEGRRENLFNAIASDGEVTKRERRPLQDFLEEP